MKNIIITAGPTNERIDSVMKITNMSTGALGLSIANDFLKYEEEIENIFYIAPKLAHRPAHSKINYIQIESADDLLSTISYLLNTYEIDTVVHSSAVGDYLGEYCITGELLADEIANKIYNKVYTKAEIYNIILDSIENPNSLVNNEGKISSYEKNLIVKLGLTPKVISKIKELSPNTKLIGFKLLDGVSKEELYNVAYRLLQKNNADYIVANDLSKISKGNHWAMILNNEGNILECHTKNEIAENIVNITLNNNSEKEFIKLKKLTTSS